MKFKVGDKVKVKSLSWYNSNKNHYGFVNDDNCSEPFSNKMAEYCGKVLEITAISENAPGFNRGMIALFIFLVFNVFNYCVNRYMTN